MAAPKVALPQAQMAAHRMPAAQMAARRTLAEMLVPAAVPMPEAAEMLAQKTPTCLQFG